MSTPIRNALAELKAYCGRRLHLDHVFSDLDTCIRSVTKRFDSLNGAIETWMVRGTIMN